MKYSQILKFDHNCRLTAFFFILVKNILIDKLIIDSFFKICVKYSLQAYNYVLCYIATYISLSKYPCFVLIWPDITYLDRVTLSSIPRERLERQASRAQQETRESSAPPERWVALDPPDPVDQGSVQCYEKIYEKCFY